MTEGILAGLVLDRLLGDPRRGHPVAAFGAAATRLEHAIYAPTHSRGVVYLSLCVGPVVLGAVVAQRILRAHPMTYGGAIALASWATLGGTTLAREAEGLAAALEHGDLAEARARLPRLCGREPWNLDATELSRAGVESVAENTSDAVTAPLLWAAVGGLPGMLGYRVINTCDAMVGHHSQRYARFGWAAARLDDAANWVPARATALAAILAAPLVGGSPRQAWRTWRQYGHRHPSPNAGQCEAAFAGALGVRLGGANSYHQHLDERPELGTGRPPEPADIRRAVRLGRAVAALSTGMTVAGAFALHRCARRRS